MSEEMTDHVLSAIVDQIPDEHLIKAHELIEKRMDTSSYQVTVPYQAKIEGRLVYHIEARTKDGAIQLAGESMCEPDESTVDQTIGQYEEFWEHAEAEER